MTKTHAEFILPLVAAQPYIATACFDANPINVSHDFSNFRATYKYRHGELLTHWQARACNIEPHAVDMSPWLAVKPSPETAGKAVFARSPREQNPDFPWLKYFFRYGAQAVFIGNTAEHDAFTHQIGFVPHREVGNALEMAALIAGSELFIGNQSLPYWIAMGLGHQMIQETSPSQASYRQNPCPI